MLQRNSIISKANRLMTHDDKLSAEDALKKVGNRSSKKAIIAGALLGDLVVRSATKLSTSGISNNKTKNLINLGGELVGLVGGGYLGNKYGKRSNLKHLKKISGK